MADDFEPDFEASKETTPSRLYRQYVAEPGTTAVKQLLKLADVTGYSPKTPEVQQGLEAARRGTAEFAVPQTPLQAGIMAGTMGAGGLAAKAGSRALPAAIERIAGAGLGGTVGGALEGRPPEQGLVAGAGPTAALEAIAPGMKWLLSKTPGAKARINEQQAGRVQDIANIVSPEVGQAIETAKATVRPGTRGVTQAATQEAVLGGGAQQNLSDRMERVVQGIEQAAPNLAIDTPALQQGYRTLPLLDRQRIGAPGPNGFTLRQAQEIRSYVGSGAFAQSRAGQGVSPVSKQDLWSRISGDMDAAIGRATTTTPGMLTGWRVANRDYAAGQALSEGLQATNAFGGRPNEIYMNRNALSDWLSRNRQDLRARMGAPQYEAVVNAMLEGGQPGTKDILASGSGASLDALRQVYGRGQGGAPQIVGSVLRTGLPNIGSQYTGYRPPGVAASAQTILDLLGQRLTPPPAPP